MKTIIVLFLCFATIHAQQYQEYFHELKKNKQVIFEQSLTTDYKEKAQVDPEVKRQVKQLDKYFGRENQENAQGSLRVLESSMFRTQPVEITEKVVTNQSPFIESEVAFAIIAEGMKSTDLVFALSCYELIERYGKYDDIRINSENIKEALSVLAQNVAVIDDSLKGPSSFRGCDWLQGRTDISHYPLYYFTDLSTEEIHVHAEKISENSNYRVMYNIDNSLDSLITRYATIDDAKAKVNTAQLIMSVHEEYSDNAIRALVGSLGSGLVLGDSTRGFTSVRVGILTQLARAGVSFPYHEALSALVLGEGVTKEMQLLVFNEICVWARELYGITIQREENNDRNVFVLIDMISRYGAE